MKNFSKNIRKFLVLGTFLFMISLLVGYAVPVFAQQAGSGATPATSGSGTTVNCGTTPSASGCLPNPLQVSSVSDILYLAVDIATYVGVVLAVVFLIYAGFKYISAQGNQVKVTEAHHFLLSVVIGIAILIGARAIVGVVETTLTSAGLVSSSTFGPPQ